MTENKTPINAKREMPKVDPGMAAAFLHAVAPKGRFSLVSMEKSAKNRLRVEGRTVDLHHGTKSVRAFVEQNASKSLYWQVNEVSSSAKEKAKYDAKDVSSIRGVFADFDLDKEALGPNFEGWEDEKARIRDIADRLLDSETPPTVIVSSGGGIQAIWLLEEPVSALGIQTGEFDEIVSAIDGQVLQIERRRDARQWFHQIQSNLLAANPDADPKVKDLPRILRLPGSVNLKRQGYERQAVAIWVRREPESGAWILDTNSAGLGSPRYTVEELEAGWPNVDAPMPKYRTAEADLGAIEDEMFDAEPREGLIEYLNTTDGHLGRLWRDGPDAFLNPDKSGSQCRFQLGVAMKRRGFSPADYWMALGEWGFSRGANDYDERDAVRAWGAIVIEGGADLPGGDEFDAIAEDAGAAATPAAATAPTSPPALTIEGMTPDEIATAIAFGEIEAPADAPAPAAPVEKPAKFKRRHVMIRRAKVLDSLAEIAEALAEHHPERLDNLYQQHGTLLCLGSYMIRNIGPDGEPQLVPAYGLYQASAVRIERCMLSRLEFTTERRTRGGDTEIVPAEPPSKVIEALLLSTEAGRFRFEPVTSFCEGPILKADGTLHTKRGLDRSTGTVTGRDWSHLSIPDRPTEADARSALATLESLLVEFPWGGDSEDERRLNTAVAICLMLTAVARPILPTAPMGLFDAVAPGSGKTELSKLICAFGSSKAVPLATCGNDEEFAKRLEGLLLARAPQIVFDNLSGILNGDALKAALTAESMTIRPLGVSEQQTIPMKSLIIVNGNNLRASDDLSRRAIIARLDPRCERPEARTFTGNPVAEVQADRGRYVAAVATIIRWFITSGGKVEGALAGYQQWFCMCAAPLIALGLPNPVESQGAIRDADPVRSVMTPLLAELHRLFGSRRFTTGALAELMVSGSCEGLAGADVTEADFDSGELPPMPDTKVAQELLHELVGGSRGSVPHILARRLGAQKDRQFGPFALRQATRQRSDGNNPVKGWTVEAVNGDQQRAA